MSWRRGRKLDIQDDIGIAESERELPEIIDQDSDGNMRVSSSIIRKCVRITCLPWLIE